MTGSEIIIDNNVILDGEGNLTVDGGDAHRVFAVLPSVTAELVDLRVTGGEHEPLGSESGRTIRNEGSLTLTDCVLAGWGRGPGTTQGHAAIYSDGSLNLRGSVVRDYSAGFKCGGIESVGSLTLVDTTVSGIDATDGHAICSSGSLVMIGSAIVDNPTIGGAIYSVGVATLINSTVSGLTRSVAASAIAAQGALTLINSTLVYSRTRPLWTISAGDWGGGEADLFVANSIIVGPENATPPNAACAGFDTISGGGNIESPGDTCGLTDPTDLVNVTADDLKLGPLADNGGPTMTHALLPGSVAIDWIPEAMCLDAAGDPLTTDQRGVDRPQGAMCDVGAFESADCAGSVCDDGNDCIADHCDPNDYSWCVYTTLPDGMACDFGGLVGVCASGACVRDCGFYCDDGNACTADYCDPPDYASCEHSNLPERTSCDLGGAPGVCEAGQCVPPRLVFVTDTVQNANLGGIAGADALCASQAAAVGLQGEFKAWLSTVDSPVADRFVQSTMPYVLVDGTRVADDWTDLTDGSIQAPINLDANGGTQTGDVWTGTMPSGSPYTDTDCDAFMNGVTGFALCGSTAQMFNGWTAVQVPSCDTQLRLYCFEQ